MQIKTLITSGVLQHNLLNNKNIVLSALKIVLGFPLEFRLWFTYGNDSEILSIFIAKSPNLSFSRVHIHHIHHLFKKMAKTIYIICSILLLLKMCNKLANLN